MLTILLGGAQPGAKCLSRIIGGCDRNELGDEEGIAVMSPEVILTIVSFLGQVSTSVGNGGFGGGSLPTL